jgi:DNA (cytosine-5)-methyltransferase 1
MGTYTCNKCEKKFSQKSHYSAHLKRKTPCISESKIRELALSQSHSPRAVDLFSGAGGLTYGFVECGYKILFGVEHDFHASQTYRSNFKHPMMNVDIQTLDADALVKEYGKADIVFGGPPCQGFSMAGKRDNKDPRNSLFMDYLRFVKSFEPKYFVMENVPGILTMKTQNGEFVKDIIVSECRAIGYNIKWKKLYAPDYGVPQKRRRVIFLGWKETDAEPTYPIPTHTKETYVPINTILLDKTQVEEKYYHSQKMIDGFMKRLKKNKEEGKGFGAQFIKENEPCYTISARYYKDGCDALVKYSDIEIRKLTEKEVARVQTFPDTFIFPSSSIQTYKQIGNAVPCLLAKVIANQLLNFLKI